MGLKNIIFQKQYTEFSVPDGDRSSATMRGYIYVTQETNGFAIFDVLKKENVAYGGETIAFVQFFNEYERDKAIEFGLDKARTQHAVDRVTGKTKRKGA